MTRELRGGFPALVIIAAFPLTVDVVVLAQALRLAAAAAQVFHDSADAARFSLEPPELALAIAAEAGFHNNTLQPCGPKQLALCRD